MTVTIVAPAARVTEGDGGSTRRTGPGGGRYLPTWFERGLTIAAAAVVSFGGFGLLLAIVDGYRILYAAILGIAGTVLGCVLAWPTRRSAAATPRGVVLPAIGMCLVAAGLATWNAVDAGHHVIIGRDPGVYAVTGKWIAQHGSLEVPTGKDWTSKDPTVTVVTLGTYPEDGTRVEFQFNHLLPVLLAEADNVGSDRLMFRVPALLGALGLCAVYAVGCRLVRRPWLVLAAVTALGVSLPQLNISRDTYSESSAQFLLWAGLGLLLLAHERRRASVGVVAGAVLGGVVMTRIDGLAYLLPLPLLAALWCLTAHSSRERRTKGRLCLAVFAGAVPTVVLGTLDARQRAGHYYVDLGPEVRALQAAAILSLVLGTAAVLARPLVLHRAARVVAAVRERRAGIGVVCGTVVAAGLLLAWALRPVVSHHRAAPVPLVGGLQRAAGLPNDPGRTYAEDSVRWLGWYLGPITVGLAIAGAALIVAAVIERLDPAAALIMSSAGAGTVLYLWNPAIAPDQIWAMRRFVPAALPLCAVLAAFALAAVLPPGGGAARWERWARPAGGVAAVALIAFPLAVSVPVRRFQPQGGYLSAIKALCAATGPRAAIVLAAGDPSGQQITAAVRSWCDVPVATLTQTIPPARSSRLAAAWRVEGRTLWTAGSAKAVVEKSVPGVHAQLVASATSSRDLEMTINRPPNGYAVGSITIYAARVA